MIINRSMKRWCAISCLTLTAMFGMHRGALAQSPAYSFSTGSWEPYYDNYVGGNLFTANATVDVSELGFWDYQDNGLATSHVVGLFDASGNLLASTTIDAGTTDTLIGDFRYKPLATPVTLTAGSQYTMAAVMNIFDASVIYNGNDRFNSTGLAESPLITIAFYGAVYTYTNPSVLSDPTYNYGYEVYAGPNMILGDITPPTPPTPPSPPASSTPEPGVNALLVSGAVAGYGVLRRRRS